MIKKYYLSILLIFSIGHYTSECRANDLNFNISNLCEYVGKFQTNSNGKTNLCSFLPTFASSYEIPMTKEFSLSPQLGFTFPKSGRDENVSRLSIFLLMNSKYKTKYLNFILGTGLFFTRISGPGGDSTLNNGTGSDSFPLPQDPVYSRNIILNVATEIDFNQEWSGMIYSYLFNVLSKDKRAFSLGLGFRYNYGEI